MKKIKVNRPQTTVHSKKWLLILMVLLTTHYSLLTTHIYSQTSIGVAIGTSTTITADHSAILDVSGIDKGVLINRMHTGEYPTSPADNLLIYDTDLNCFMAYVNGGWKTVSCPVPCLPPPAPKDVHTTSLCSNNFTASWTPSNGATSYFIDVSTISDFSSFVEVPNNVVYNTFSTGYIAPVHNYANPPYNTILIDITCSFKVTGLNPSTSYYYRVRAGNGNCYGDYGNDQTTTSQQYSQIKTHPPLTPVSNLVGTLKTAGHEIDWNWTTPAGYTCPVFEITDQDGVRYGDEGGSQGRCVWFNWYTPYGQYFGESSLGGEEGHSRAHLDATHCYGGGYNPTSNVLPNTTYTIRVRVFDAIGRNCKDPDPACGYSEATSTVTTLP